jgi:hypothetical protein
MGIDRSNIINHKLHYTNAATLINQLEQCFQLPVCVSSMYDDYDKTTHPPDEFDGLSIYTKNGATLDEWILKKELLEFDRVAPHDPRGFFYMNPHIMKMSLEETYMCRWYGVRDMCSTIKEYGLKKYADYNITKGLVTNAAGGSFILQMRENAWPHIKKTGATAMLTFCDDYHSQYVDQIEEHWSFDDFISWGKKDFIFVDFKDLANFDFPETKPEMYNVMVYDSFEDLK